MLVFVVWGQNVPKLTNFQISINYKVQSVFVSCLDHGTLTIKRSKPQHQTTRQREHKDL
jgi:hypothetical protein